MYVYMKHTCHNFGPLRLLFSLPLLQFHLPPVKVTDKYTSCISLQLSG